MDTIVLALVLGGLAWAAISLVDLESYYAAMSIAVITAYEIVMTKVRGQTLGKMLVRIRVVMRSDLAMPGWRTSIVRYAVPTIAAWLVELAVSSLSTSYSFWTILVLPAFYLTAVLDRNRQGVHDKAARTIVVADRSKQTVAGQTRSLGEELG